MPGLPQSRLDLACEPSATRYAVAHATEVLRTWGVPREVAADARLIVDELVTNAVRHAGAQAAPFQPEQGRPSVRSCGLALWAHSGHLVISVYDEVDQLPILRDLSLDAESGRGLQLVAGLSEGNWGCSVLRPRPGKLVWARLQTGPTVADDYVLPLGARQLTRRALPSAERHAGVIA